MSLKPQDQKTNHERVRYAILTLESNISTEISDRGDTFDMASLRWTMKVDNVDMLFRNSSKSVARVDSFTIKHKNNNKNSCESLHISNIKVNPPDTLIQRALFLSFHPHPSTSHPPNNCCNSIIMKTPSKIKIKIKYKRILNWYTRNFL